MTGTSWDIVDVWLAAQDLAIVAGCPLPPPWRMDVKTIPSFSHSISFPHFVLERPEDTSDYAITGNIERSDIDIVDPFIVKEYTSMMTLIDKETRINRPLSEMGVEVILRGHPAKPSKHMRAASNIGS